MIVKYSAQQLLHITFFVKTFNIDQKYKLSSEVPKFIQFSLYGQFEISCYP